MVQPSEEPVSAIEATVSVDEASLGWGDKFINWLSDSWEEYKASWRIQPKHPTGDFGLDFAHDLAWTADHMRNLAPRALTAAEWVLGPAEALGKLGFGKLAAWAGFNTDLAADPSGTVYADLNNQISQANRELQHIGGSFESVVVRLDGNAFELEAVNLRDIDNDGRAEVVAGFGGGEYLLAVDLNRDGNIHPPTELVSRGLGGDEFASADDALASLDSNGDGRLDGSDSAYGHLYLVGSATDGGSTSWTPLGATGVTAIALGESSALPTKPKGSLGSTLDHTIGTEGIAAGMAVVDLGLAPGGFDLVDQSQSAGQTVNGSLGSDLLFALHAGVTLNGGNASDVLVSTFADTIMIGGSGQDVGVFLTDDAVTVNAAAFGLEAVVTGAGDDVLRAGSSRSTALEGGSGADLIYGRDGDDTLIGGVGDDRIDGGQGFDVAWYRGRMADYTISAVTDAIIVNDRNARDGDEGRDRLTGVEVARFADGVVWLGPTAFAAGPGEAPWVFDETLVSASSIFRFSAADLVGNDQDPEGGPVSLVSVKSSAGKLTQLDNGGYRLVAPGPGDRQVELRYIVTDTDGQTTAGHAMVAFRPLPTDTLMDASWHLFVDNVRAAWPDYSGKGIHVAINEPEDFSAAHPEIASSYLGNLPAAGAGAHGIVVASVLLSAHDGLGTAGVAAGAEFSKWVLGGGFEPGHEFYVSRAADPFGDADIVNNSWTYPAFSRGSIFQSYVPQRDGLSAFASEGRDGLGGISVFSTVNLEPGSAERVDYQYLHSARQAIAVTYLDETGEAQGGAPGASLLVSAAGAHVPAADRVGEGGYAGSDDMFGADYAVLSGSSLAAPMVSGIVAMMLEANPELGYRDVQQILAYSTRMTDAADRDWLVNGASDWNGGGLRWNESYGFGRVDALAAVRLAESWHQSRTEANLASRLLAEDGKLRYAAPDAVLLDVRNFNPATQPGGNIIVEHVELTLHGISERGFDGTIYDTIADTYRLSFELRSPSGTTVALTTRDGPYDSRFIPEEWTFTATGFWGESVRGNWTLIVHNHESVAYGSSFDAEWSLTLTGRPDNGNDIYVYTNSFADFAPLGSPQRYTLGDDAGIDEINAAAVSAPIVLDLSRQVTSHIGERALTIAAGTVIENAIGGDSDDSLLGNRAANRLDGARGDDLLNGADGDDTLLGGPGYDVLAGGKGLDRLDGGDGQDRLFGGGGPDALRGGSGNDLLDGGAGDDRLNGGSGADIFVFSASYGSDLIADFSDGTDRIDLRDFGFATAAQALRLASQSGADVIFTFSPEDALTVRKIALDDFSAADFLL